MDTTTTLANTGNRRAEPFPAARLFGRHRADETRVGPWRMFMKEMSSLIIATVAGALVTGGTSALLAMSSPAYAEGVEAVQVPEGEGRARMTLAPLLISLSDPAQEPPTLGSRALETLPICVCMLPAPDDE